MSHGPDHGASIQGRLGERLQQLRHERELTQEAVAHRSGISQKYLSELERGEKAPSWETMVALAHKGFRVRLASLLFAIDDDVSDLEPTQIADVLAGRPESVRYDVLRAVQLLLRAGEKSRTFKKP